MMNNIVDTHFHTQSMLEKGVDCIFIYRELFSQGFAGGIDIGCTHNDLPKRASLLKDFPKILLSGAMGPWEAGRSETRPAEPEFENERTKDYDQILRELEILKSNIEKYNVPFIGEIGLDYYWEYGNHDKQHLIFETQMKWAQEMNKRVLIHDRDADSDTIEVIRRLGPDKGGVIHCFDGCQALMDVALDHGFYISFAGNLTFKKNTELREMLKKVPHNRLLLETDSPYLTPVPHRGKLNNPSYVFHTYECASQVLGLELQDLTNLILENYRTFIS